MPSNSFTSLSELVRLRIDPESDAEFYLGTHVNMLFRSVFRATAVSFLDGVPHIILTCAEKTDLMLIYPEVRNFTKFCSIYYRADDIDQLFSKCSRNHSFARRGRPKKIRHDKFVQS